MTNGWKEHTLGGICRKIGSGATPRGGKETYSDDGEIALIRSQNVLDFTFSTDGLAYINDKQAQDLRNVIVEKNDILLNITGDSVARVCQVPDNILPARVNQHVCIIRPDDEILLPDFLKYTLLNPPFKNFMLGLGSTGGTRNALTKSMIENFQLVLPPLETQTEIASILSAFDDKIELNRQMNKTLETIAQTLFTDWFVRFNFPGFDGKLVDDLPKGWRKGTLGNLISVQNGFAFKSSDFRAEGSNGVIKIKNISNNIVDIDNTQYIDDEIVENINSRFRINSSDLLIAMTGAEVGKVGVVPSTNKSLWLNQRVGKIIDKCGFSKWYAYVVMSSEESYSNFQNSSVGSAQPNISASQIEFMGISIPDESVLQLFDSIVSSLFDRIVENYAHNILLAQLRDRLLPKLMSGQIPVGADV